MTTYTPPVIWDYESVKAKAGGKFGGTNRPTAGATHEQTLPIGDAPYQLYSLNTPNGIKVNILLEELKNFGKITGFDAYKINIMSGDQFGSDFVKINPNSKIPALLDMTTAPPTPVFESGAILLYLAEKHQAFIPSELRDKAKLYSWLMWQMGSAPFVGGGFGHFYAYAPYPMEYPIDRYAMETKRQLDVLNKHLADREYIMGDEYSIADMAIYPWYGRLCLGELYVGEHYDAAKFLAVHEYTHIIRWAKMMATKPTVQAAQTLELLPIA
ncbi:glutathione-dependent disulfide-bond oxidoreductase [Moraxella sp. FZFQ2102]|uniref:glutathione-dependent disulfide-bond oxidoreductase n=1 Tax=Moraxella sp. FZFQ2102 TaxID=2953752 RepID=UPI00209C307E|nr:glutathione-dependent disulfide-bond oxidoreductase [Moraxella sp. FZFQ2102]USZ14709.1 glutathione-dependent disulfide-bond oxidoreductase [Moraxella sp. FZFQ2102]